jgi:hypothetical protein
VSALVEPGSVWASADERQVFVVDDYDGAYGYVTNVAGHCPRYPESRIQRDHFGRTYRLVTL